MKKKYIPVTLEIEPSIIGVNNGIYQTEIKPDNFKKTENYKLLEKIYEDYKFDSSINRHINPEIEIEYCQLLKKAKQTNFLSFSPFLMGCHFIIDQKTFDIFGKYNFGNYSKFIPLILFESNGQLVKGNFYLLFQDLMLNSWIDFGESVFYKGHEVTGDKEILNFINPTEYKKELFTNTEQIKLNQDFDLTLDFFKSRIDSSFFISENLLTEIKKNKLTGIRITERINEITVANIGYNSAQLNY